MNWIAAQQFRDSAPLNWSASLGLYRHLCWSELVEWYLPLQWWKLPDQYLILIQWELAWLYQPHLQQEYWLHPQTHPWPDPSEALQCNIHLFPVPVQVSWLLGLGVVVSCSEDVMEVVWGYHGWQVVLLVRQYVFDLCDCDHPSQGDDRVYLLSPSSVSDQ